METDPFVLFIFGQKKKKIPSQSTVLKAYRAAGSTDGFELKAVDKSLVSHC